jgi:hypothetical protein
MSTKPQHRPTPTQRLRADIATLEAEKAALAQLVGVVDDSVYERRFLIAGHAEGPAAYVAMHRYGNAWAVIDSNAGHRAPSWWDGSHWQDMAGGQPRIAMYRFAPERAEELARDFAQVAAERHHRNALLARARRSEEHAAQAVARHADRVSA